MPTPQVDRVALVAAVDAVAAEPTADRARVVLGDDPVVAAAGHLGHDRQRSGRACRRRCPTSRWRDPIAAEAAVDVDAPAEVGAHCDGVIAESAIDVGPGLGRVPMASFRAPPSMAMWPKLIVGARATSLRSASVMATSGSPKPGERAGRLGGA
jgi:hypothetical protein